MIISRTPLRMSFVGGGSDMASYYRENRGAVVSTAIDKYIYVTVSPKFDQGVRVAYSKTEEVGSSSEVEHKLVRAGLNLVGISGGIEITTVADIPSRGTGLGSSSTFTVGLLNALQAFQGRHIGREDLATQACRVEIDICGEPIGKQDQYAAAYGGLHLYEFNADETVTVTPVIGRQPTMAAIESHLLMLYTGVTRSASALLKEQSAIVESNADKRATMKRMVDLCYDLIGAIQSDDLAAFGEILHEGWVLKRAISDKISNDRIDDWYQRARKAGAMGGKILGAGAGGFLALLAPPERHAAIRHALPELKAVPVSFDRVGSQIIFYQPRPE